MMLSDVVSHCLLYSQDKFRAQLAAAQSENDEELQVGMQQYVTMFAAVSEVLTTLFQHQHCQTNGHGLDSWVIDIYRLTICRTSKFGSVACADQMHRRETAWNTPLGAGGECQAGRTGARVASGGPWFARVRSAEKRPSPEDVFAPGKNIEKTQLSVSPVAFCMFCSILYGFGRQICVRFKDTQSDSKAWDTENSAWWSMFHHDLVLLAWHD